MVSDLFDACFCTAPRSYLPGYCVFVLCRPTSQPGPRLSIPIYPTARHCLDIVYFDKNSSVALTFFPSTETTTWLDCPGFSWRSLAHHRFSRRLCHWSGRRVETYSKGEEKVYERSANYAYETTSDIRTVAALTHEDDVWNHYHEQFLGQVDRDCPTRVTLRPTRSRDLC